MTGTLDLAQKVCDRTLALGADEASVTVSSGSHTTLIRRDGKVEQATQSTTRGLVVSLLVDDRFSSHSTSDLRPPALESFLDRAVAATRYLEADADRALPDPALCGRGATDAELQQWDPAWGDRTPADRAAQAEAVEAALDARRPEGTISSATYVADGASEAARVMSNGFRDETRGAWFSVGGEMTLADPSGRRPEASSYYSMRHLSDLPSPDRIADEVVQRALERIGSKPIASGSYPLVLENRVAGRIVGALGGPLSGASLHHGRSCLAGKLGERVGSEHFTLVDDPLLPRGLGSRPWDGDGLQARRRPIFESGVLRNLYLSVYYARKLDMAPTTGGRSNWIIPAGDRSVKELTKDYPQAVLVNGFLGGNSNGVTGDFSFGIRGVLLEHGEPTRSLSEMNVSGNLLSLFHRLVAVGDDPWRYSSLISPTLIFEDVQFSGT